MRLLIDEDLSPVLAQVAHARGYDAVAIRDRGQLGLADWQVLELCLREDRVLVSANVGDFRALAARQELHPGLITLPSVSRPRQLELLEAVLGFVEGAAAEDAMSPAGFMVNRAIEIDTNGSCAAYDLP